MAKKQAVNKTQAVRDYLKARRGAMSGEIAAALNKQGIKIKPGHVANIKSQINKGPRRRKRPSSKQSPRRRQRRRPWEASQHHHHRANQGGGSDGQTRWRGRPLERTAGTRQGSRRLKEVQGFARRHIRLKTPASLLLHPEPWTGCQGFSFGFPGSAWPLRLLAVLSFRRRVFVSCDCR